MTNSISQSLDAIITKQNEEQINKQKLFCDNAQNTVSNLQNNLTLLLKASAKAENESRAWFLTGTKNSISVHAPTSTKYCDWNGSWQLEPAKFETWSKAWDWAGFIYQNEDQRWAWERGQIQDKILTDIQDKKNFNINEHINETNAGNLFLRAIDNTNNQINSINKFIEDNCKTTQLEIANNNANNFKDFKINLDNIVTDLASKQAFDAKINKTIDNISYALSSNINTNYWNNYMMWDQ